MSAGYNCGTLLGRLASPPEQLQTENGKLFIKATIAVTVHRKNPERVDEERRSFIPATIFGRQAEVFLKYLTKAEMVHLVGRLDSNEWKTDSGEKLLLLSFIVDQLNLVPNSRAKSQPAHEKRSRELERSENDEPHDIPF